MLRLENDGSNNMTEPRVCIVPEYPLPLMEGGTLVQAVETCKGLTRWSRGMKFELFKWSEMESPADCYHFIGLPHYLARICLLIAQARRPYVVTVLMGNPNPGAWRTACWRRRIASWAGWSRTHQIALERASTLIAITPEDADAIACIFRIPRKRIQVVPVAVSPVFFQAQPDLWRSHYGSEPFVLCVGAIQARKNQLQLVKTCNDSGLALVLVGGTLQGEEGYGEQVKAAMAENQRIGGRWLRCDDDLLASAYAACRVFVLLSQAETQPASVLQAMALQKPILLGDVSYARNHPFDRLRRVDLGDAREGARALAKIWAEEPPSALPEEFTERNVCQLLAAIYARTLGNSTGVTGSQAGPEAAKRPQ